MVQNAPIAVHLPIPTQVGLFILCEAADGTLSARWESDDTRVEPAVIDRWETLAAGASLHLVELRERLRHYFAGEEVSFDDVPTPKGPRFFQRCWEACRQIRPGETRSYAALAVMTGATAASARAAGQAMRRNPLPVIVPCHRVIGSSGLLHGYAGSTDNGGTPLRRKEVLLLIEGRCSPRRAGFRYDC